MIDFKDGDEVRLVDGRVGVISDINPNPDYLDDDEYYAEFSDYGEVDAADDVVEVVRTAEQLAARRVPTQNELRDFISSAVHTGWDDDIRTSETARDGEGAFELFGYTGEGLPFAARIVVEMVWEADE